MECGFKQCKLQPLAEADAHIKIKVAVLSGWADSDHNATLVAWKQNGEACFHKICWDAVLLAAQSRRRSGPGTMRQSEKLMVRQAGKTAESFDSLEEVKAAAKATAELIKKSPHCIAFTGAGISTSAGLGDFRGKSGKWTVEDQHSISESISRAFHAEAAVGCSGGVDDDSSTGPPAKMRRSTGEAASTTCAETSPDEVEEDEMVEYEILRPTYTHESLHLLLSRGYLHYIISQNCDGLHLLSGVPAEKLSSLHGDVFVEKCEVCGKRYSRDFYVLDDASSQYFEELQDNGSTDIKKPEHAVKCSLCGLSHRTGRKCEEKGCSGYLIDTIINFRDHLEEEILSRAETEAGQSDLILCLGTTLMVTPAADLVDMAKGKQPLVICNRQKTEKDDKAQVRIFGDCDSFMRCVLRHLLPTKELEEWEAGRQERLQKYQKQRTAVIQWQM